MPQLAGVKWIGLDSFEAELRALTSNLVDEANAIMQESAEAAKAHIAAEYPERSGALRRGLVIQPARGIVLAGAELIQTAPHGWIYEHGTQARTNAAGANRGQMPAMPTFIPIATSYRRSAISDVMFRLYQHGATRVTGTADAA